MAKGLTSAVIPMGAVAVSDEIHQTIVENVSHEGIELFHGYTYSGHPMAVAAALAALEVYEEEQIFDKVKNLSKYWEDGLHSLANAPHVIDIRNLGLAGAIELEPLPNKNLANEAFLHAYQNGLLIRVTGHIIALSPPLICEKQHVDSIVQILSETLQYIATS